MIMMKVMQRMMMFESGAHRQGVQSITEITSSLPLARTSHCGACMCCIGVIIINLNIKEEKLFFEKISFKIRLKTLSHCHRPPSVGPACAAYGLSSSTWLSRRENYSSSRIHSKYYQKEDHIVLDLPRSGLHVLSVVTLIFTEGIFFWILLT